ncbi:MAG: helix-hairpin-helix domain-containing protein [candidate division WOR-3 bacterium]|nr:MAG: helix-hairpin-helix domain-containing protein [candidate division WOR-3 bacterium]
MKKKEIIVLAILVGVLIAVNALNFVRKERVKHSYTMLVERGLEKLPLNAVGTGELEDLPGIGRVLARRIVAYRNQIGEFKSLDELKEVKGIGDKLYERISPYLEL